MGLVWEHRVEDGCFAVEGIVYCDHPVAPELQRLNIYIPESYLTPHAQPGHSPVVSHGGRAYMADEAPIVLYNDIGGYAECRPAPLTLRNRRFLSDGYVLVSVGARGRQSVDENGCACGKSPAALVDLKAAVRWLRAHKEDLPAGDVERIISVGTSAGGAMSSLLAVTGNDPAFDLQLAQIGAVPCERDDIFAAQCYCPIVDLDHADMAYEWMFGSKTIYAFRPQQLPEVLDPFQRELSHELALAYPDYVNGLDLGLALGSDGRSGSYYHALMDELSRSLDVFLMRNAGTADECAVLIEEIDHGAGFIGWDGECARIEDLDAYVRAYLGRKKGCPSFDTFNGTSPENQEFGSSGAAPGSVYDMSHFSRATMSIIQKTAGRMGDCAHAEIADVYDRDLAREGLRRAVDLLNPMVHLAQGRAKAGDVAPHVRIRVGSRDADTSFTVSFNLARALERSGTDVDYALVWGEGHGDADYPGEFSAWVDSIVK